MSAATHCQGCGTELPPPKKFNHKQKWCSERCRKMQYSTPCIDCGAPTNGSDGRGPNASERCAECHKPASAQRQREAFTPFQQMVEEMWAEGMTSRQIGEALGWKTTHPAAHISVLRSRGYDLPHRRTHEQIARICADKGAHLRWARAVKRAREMAA